MGTATSGMIVARQLCSERYTTQDNEEQRLEKGLVDFMDGGGDVFGIVQRDLVMDPFGEGLAQFLEFRLYPVYHVQRIGPGKHIDAKYGRIFPVHAAFGIVRGGFQRYTRYVPQADDAAVRVGPHHDILELGHIRQTSFRGDRDGDVDVLGGLLAQHAGGGLPVLLLDGALDILYRDPRLESRSGYSHICIA